MNNEYKEKLKDTYNLYKKVNSLSCDYCFSELIFSKKQYDLYSIAGKEIQELVTGMFNCSAIHPCLFRIVYNLHLILEKPFKEIFDILINLDCITYSGLSIYRKIGFNCTKVGVLLKYIYYNYESKKFINIE